MYNVCIYVLTKNKYTKYQLKEIIHAKWKSFIMWYVTRQDKFLLIEF